MANAAAALGAPPTTADLAQMLGGGSVRNTASSPIPIEHRFVPGGDWTTNLSSTRPVSPNADPNMTTTAPETGSAVWLTGPTWKNLPGVWNVSDQRQMPAVGPMQGQLFLNAQIAPQVPEGAPRPFAPGEYVKNQDGSWSSEITGTIEQGQYPELNGGKATIVPTLWIVNGVPTRVDEDTAAGYAVQSGLPFQSFDSNAAAEAYSQQRENLWQTIQPEQAGQIPALWAAPTAGEQ